MYVCLLLQFLVIQIEIISGSSILGFFIQPSFSNFKVASALTELLSRCGHELTITVPLKSEEVADNVTHIDVTNTPPIWKNTMASVATVGTTRSGSNVISTRLGCDCLNSLLEAQMKLPQVQYIFNDTFDLIILQSLTWTAYGIAHIFKKPVVTISSFTTIRAMFEMVGAPTHPVLYRDVQSRAGIPNRIWDKMICLLDDLTVRYDEWIALKKYQKKAERLFGDDLPDLDYLGYERTDVMFLNIHMLWSGIRPAPSTLVFLGGLHLRPSKMLTQDMQDFLDSSTRGVVIMSLGSNLRSSFLSAAKVRVFVDAFRRLPYDILWKWEENELPQKPDNVKICKWFQQPDVLRHPNVKAMITQCGLQTTDEAIAAEVPLIGLPFVWDQFQNARRYEDYEIGVILDIESLDVETLVAAVKEVVENKRYLDNMKKLSVLMRDQPQSSHEAAIWWTEYALRHNGTRHLRAPQAGLVDYFMFDVLAFGIIIFLIGLLTIILFSIWICKMSCKCEYFVNKLIRGRN